MTKITRSGGNAASAAGHRTCGSNALSASTYRTGQTLKDEQTGEWFKGDRSTYGLRIIGSEIIAPEWTPKALLTSRGLWNAVEQAEKRKDARLAMDYHVGLPMEWSQRQRETVVREFVWQEFTCKGLIVEASYHAYGSSYRPGTEAWSKREAELAKENAPYFELKDRPADATGPYVLTIRRKDGAVKEYYVFQPHVHLMMPYRAASSEGLSSHKLRCPPEHKNNQAWERRQLIDLRKAWEKHANIYLPADRQISAESNKARGLKRDAQVNVGMAGTKLARDGKSTERWVENEKIKDLNAEREKRARLTQFKAERSKVAAEVVALEPRRRAKMDHQTPEEYAKEHLKAQAKAVSDLKEKAHQYAEMDRERWDKDVRDTIGRLKAERLEREGSAKKAQHEQEAQKEERDRQRRHGAIADPHLRYAIAVGETAGTPGTWADQIVAAHGRASASFLKEQDEYRRQLASPQVGSAQKEELSLRKQIEFLDYRAVTTEDLIRTYKVIGGRTHLGRAEQMQDKVFEARMTAASLRERHDSIMREREQDVERRRAEPYKGRDRRQTPDQFEAQHREDMRYIKRVATPQQLDQLEANHQRARSVREDYETGRQKERRSEKSSTAPKREEGEGGKERSDAKQMSKFDRMEADYAKWESQRSGRSRGGGRSR